MIVVADSGPLHYLVLLDQIDLLYRLYGQVVIPDAVASELRALGAPASVAEWIGQLPAWATVRTVSQEQIDTITDALDLGERAAIALAGEIGADLLLIDDAAGRAEAKQRNLSVTGTLGVLRTAAEQGLLDVPNVLDRLSRTSFYADPILINHIFSRWLDEK